MAQRLTAYGETIGYIEDGVGSDGERRILDENYRTVGYINNHGTFDTSRRRIADYPDAGLLLG